MYLNIPTELLHISIYPAGGISTVNQNVNAFDSRLKNWIRRFNGVATKYLDSYLGWFRTLDRSAPAGLLPASLLALAINSNTVLN